MPHLSHTQLEVRRWIQRLATRDLPIGPLAAELLDALLQVVPGDEAALFAIDPDSYLLTRLLAYTHGSLDTIMSWLRNVYLANEPTIDLTFPGLIAANLPVLVLQERLECCWGAPDSLLAQMTPREFWLAYHDIGSPAGGGVRAWFASGGRKIAVFQVARRESGSTFRRSDREFLLMLAPLIGRVLRSALERDQALCAERSDLETTGVLIVDSQGRTELQTPVVETWFRAMYGLGYVASRSGAMPVGVQAAIAAVRSGLVTGSGNASLRVPTQFGLLRVEASPADDKVSVILAPERRSTPPALPGAWPLTPQERRVLSLVAHGLTNREIATKLVISENTVETHLAHAYEKLGVNSRTRFLARLFREAYWPIHLPE